MVLAFLILLMLNGVVVVLIGLGFARVLNHMRQNPEAARLISEHVIAPLLMGKRSEEESMSPDP